MVLYTVSLRGTFEWFNETRSKGSGDLEWTRKCYRWSVSITPTPIHLVQRINKEYGKQCILWYDGFLDTSWSISTLLTNSASVLICLFVLRHYITVNNFSVMPGHFTTVFLGWTITKQRIKCLSQEHTTVPLASLKLRRPYNPKSITLYKKLLYICVQHVNG